jgi:hypothetical protein
MDIRIIKEEKQMKKFFLIFIFIISIIFIFSEKSLLIKDFEYKNEIITKTGMKIYWTFNEEKSIYMLLKAPSNGWISIGFNPTFKMKDAKIILIGFEKNNIILEEHLGVSSTKHKKIDEKYIKKYTGKRSKEFSIAEFEIPLNKESRYTITKNEIIKVITAFHNNSDNFLIRHSKRETLNIKF